MARGRVVTSRRVPIDAGWECGSGASAEAVAWIPAQVPGTAAGALRDARQWTWDDRRDFDGETWWWRTRFARPAGAGPWFLGCDGIATLSDVWLNGTRIAGGDTMFVAYEANIESSLRPDGQANELVIGCRPLATELAKKRPRPRWKVPMLEAQQLRWVRTTLLGRTPGWSPPCPAVGPWRPVWLEARPSGEVRDIWLDARLDGADGVVKIAARIDGASRVELIVTRGERRVTAALEHVGGDWIGEARVPAAERWWPHTHGAPARYELALRVDDHVIELGATGFRTIYLDHVDGGFTVRVNGARVFCRGACWTPADAVTLALSDADAARAVEQLRAAGLNMLRIGGTMVYEADALYDACDAAGILVWHDLMFANMDYPEPGADAAFDELVRVELDQQLARLQARPALAVICGNSEGEQQAAMFGATRDRWAPARFHQQLPELVAARLPHVAYTPSSAHAPDGAGAYPHAANAGASSYYGVGAYLRPLDDARRAEVKFASECLAFANIPAGPMPRVHAAAWKARSPRDLGAGWDFDDVRDHYVRQLFGVDPFAVRLADHERYLALGRVATGEVMAQVFAEWRRARSTCGGGLVWFLRDLWPGAGWGLVDAAGAAKPCWYALRRACAPIAIAITDEGVNGLALHVANDRGAPLAGTLELVAWRHGEIEVARASREVAVAPHAAMELAAASLFDHFVDLSWAHKFGPPPAQVVHAVLRAGETIVGEAFAFPAGLALPAELDVGLSATAVASADGAAAYLTVRSRRFAQFVSIEAPGFAPDDDHFHLAPGQARVIALARQAPGGTPIRGHVRALNAEVTAKIELG